MRGALLLGTLELFRVFLGVSEWRKSDAEIEGKGQACEGDGAGT